MTAAWLNLLDAIAIAGIGQEKLRELLLAGDVEARFRHPNGLRPLVPLEYWTRASIDWPRSRIQAGGLLPFSGPVEVNRATLIANAGEAAKTPVGGSGGRPPKWDWEQAALDVFAVIYGGKRPLPKRQADVERLLHEWFIERLDETGKTPSESQIREHAKKIFKAMQEA
jgi:Tc5 transposase DNA-binding domain